MDNGGVFKTPPLLLCASKVGENSVSLLLSCEILIILSPTKN